MGEPNDEIKRILDDSREDALAVTLEALKRVGDLLAAPTDAGLLAPAAHACESAALRIRKHLSMRQRVTSALSTLDLPLSSRPVPFRAKAAEGSQS